MAKTIATGGPIERVQDRLQNWPDDTEHQLIMNMVYDCFKMLDDYYRERLDQCQGRNSELSDEIVRLRKRIVRMDDQINN